MLDLSRQGAQMTLDEMYDTLFGHIVLYTHGRETELALGREVQLEPSQLLPNVSLQGQELGRLLKGIEDRLATEGLRAQEGWVGNFEDQNGHAVVKIVKIQP